MQNDNAILQKYFASLSRKKRNRIIVKYVNLMYAFRHKGARRHWAQQLVILNQVNNNST